MKIDKVQLYIQFYSEYSTINRFCTGQCHWGDSSTGASETGQYYHNTNNKFQIGWNDVNSTITYPDNRLLDKLCYMKVNIPQLDYDFITDYWDPREEYFDTREHCVSEPKTISVGLDFKFETIKSKTSNANFLPHHFESRNQRFVTKDGTVIEISEIESKLPKNLREITIILENIESKKEQKRQLENK